MMGQILHYYRLLGPGLLSAGAAIGVSHLVQSTRAGAEFGYELLWVVILANIVKYPFFEMAPRYTAATGESLLRGYRRIGQWSLVVVFVMTLATMFTIQAAVTIVTAGLAIEIFNLPLDAHLTSAGLLLLCMGLLISGRYVVLDHLVKVIILVLTVTTLCSLFGALQIEKEVVSSAPLDWGRREHLFFLAALAGWMPAPLDLSVWHSIWMQEKGRVSQQTMNLKTALLDFCVGYIGTMILAGCFLALGALVMHGSGRTFSPAAGVFAGQLIELYTEALGSWSYPLIAVAAFTTMFSTTLTCFDAFPRVLREASACLFGSSAQSRRAYNFWLSLVAIGSLVLLFLFIENMKQMVALATTLSFVLAPVYALLNYKLINSPHVPSEARLGRGSMWLCRLLIAGLAVFSLGFLKLMYL